jgi:recombination protein RecR
MDTIQKLTELFKEFPGIGPRQAKRFVYFLLTQPDEYTQQISALVNVLKKEVSSCAQCKRFFPMDASRHELCSVCRDTSRDASQLMVVLRDVDFENVEKTRSYNGYYFVLGGMVPILHEHPEEVIRQKELMEAVVKQNAQGLKEIIIAFDYNPEGEHTREYVEQLLVSFVMQNAIKVSHLGRGLSLGSELEYSDANTIKDALSGRK